MQESTTGLAVPAPELGNEALLAIEDLRSAALGRLTGHFAHELRNVLTGVHCYLELLSGLELPPHVGRFLGEVQDGLDRMADLASLWHELSRSSAATNHLNSEIARLMQLLAAAGVSKRIRLSTSLADTVGFVRADPVALEAILLEILSRTVSAAPESVSVTTRNDAGRVELCIEAFPPVDTGLRVADLSRLGELASVEIVELDREHGGFGLRFASGGAEGAS